MPRTDEQRRNETEREEEGDISDRERSKNLMTINFECAEKKKSLF